MQEELVVVDPETAQVATARRPAVALLRSVVVLVLAGLAIFVLLPALLAAQAASAI
jgi:hypothetical protein